VLTAEGHVGHEAFAVLLGDDLVDPRDPLLTTMLEVQEREGGSVIALMEVDPSQISLYGCAAVKGDGDVVQVTGLVEKPSPEEAPSNLAVLGRYVLPATIFDAIQNTKPGSGGEIQLTDAMAALLAEGTPVHGVVYRGHRYDTGMPLGYLQAVVELAAKRPDVGPEFRRWLGEFVGGAQE
jgi:UTP--glucose-1-phosphate uridylyltransferase